GGCGPRLAHSAGTARARRDTGRLVPVPAHGRARVRPLRAGRTAPGTGRDGAAAVPVAGAGAVPAAHLAEAGGDRSGEFGGTVPAVRLGGAACTGGDRRDLQRDGGAVRRAGRVPGVRREDRR